MTVADVVAELARLGPEPTNRTYLRHGATEPVYGVNERAAAAGWAALSGVVALTPDDRLDLADLGNKLDRVRAAIAAAPNRVRDAMNGFVIAAGRHAAPLTARARAVAGAVGPVAVDVGETGCKVPDAVAGIDKAAGKLGAKRKAVRC